MELPQFDEYDIRQQVLDFMRANDCYPEDDTNIILDGSIHRYKVRGDKSYEFSGAYCIYTDNLPAGWVEDWHTGQSVNWHYDTASLDKEQKDYFHSPEYKKKAEAEKKLREEKLKKKQNEAADKARIRINTLRDAPENHRYLKEKNVYPYGIKLDGDNLAIPLRDITGEVKSLQWIDPEGHKLFFPSAPLNGIFWSIGLDMLDTNPDMPILLGEGYATMAKVYELTNLPCVAGLSCYYFKSIAQALRTAYPNSKIIVMADNDKATELKRGFNPGLEHAKELIKLGLAFSLAFPEFQKPEDGSDWDDFALLYGDEKTAIILEEKIAWECLTEQELQREKLINLDEYCIATY